MSTESMPRDLVEIELEKLAMALEDEQQARQAAENALSCTVSDCNIAEDRVQELAELVEKLAESLRRRLQATPGWARGRVDYEADQRLVEKGRNISELTKVTQ